MRYVHDIDPVLFGLGGIYFWWYGLSYSLGFLNLHLYLRRRRRAIGLNLRDVYALTLYVALGVLIGGRFIEVVFDEWGFYRGEPRLIPALWLGGMATHGLLLGAFTGTALFCATHRQPFRRIADTLAIPGAVLMGLGRIGNFIDGQIAGAVTTLPWGVQFPYEEGYRHPVVLYDGVKNLLLAVYLRRSRRSDDPDGAVAARFVFWYAFTRIFVDLCRDYPTHRLALGTGQTLNLVMSGVGVLLLLRSRWRRSQPSARIPVGEALRVPPLPVQRVALAALLVFCLSIPSNWTQDVPEHYRERHPSIRRSWVYPAIDTRPRRLSALPLGVDGGHPRLHQRERGTAARTIQL